MTNIFDKRNRPLRDLRISVTDRCNYRCLYCMPQEKYKDYVYLQRKDLLTFEEISRVVRIFHELGLKKVRLTGGEPLIRKDIEKLIRLLAAIPDLDISMTTNGSFPLDRARSLRDAGLDRITLSLDSLDDAIYKKMNDVNRSVDNVLRWIDASEKAGFEHIKINMVVQRDLNMQSILPMAEHFRCTPYILRFIEYMDVGTTNDWHMKQVVPADEILKIIDAKYPLEPFKPNYPGEVARRYHYKDGGGEIGIIASVSNAFCGDCTRMRLSAHGSLYTCLFAALGTDIRAFLRGGASDEQLKNFIMNIWQKRRDRYSEVRSEQARQQKKVEMSFIGG